MSTSSLNSPVRSLGDRTSRRITVFEQQYGKAALDLACHAAFPFTLTTDLVYCLRENFVPTCPWYAAADVLLSGLCDSVGYDLYEMDGQTRRYLLARLRDRFTEQRVLAVGDFMAAYIQHRLAVERSDRPRILGDRPHWTALSCLRPGEAFDAIQQELQRLAKDSDQKERLRLASLVEGHADLLPGFQSFLIKWADQTADGEALDLTGVEPARLRQQGFPLEPREVVVATVALSDDPFDSLPFEEQPVEVATITLEYEESAAEETQRFEFEVATIERQGTEWVIQRRRQENWGFIEVLTDGVVLEMMNIPAGTFLMGSPEDEPGRYNDEGAQHEVSVSQFFMSRYPITQAQWRFVASLPEVERDLKADPSRFKGDNRPVEQVSWDDAVEFCKRLTHLVQRPGLEYRLPTEAEWEYACRAGTTTSFHFGETISPELATYNASVSYANGPKADSSSETTPVDRFSHANDFGLCDMHGNVYEWCLDHWHENYEGAPTDGGACLTDNESARRVIRGGSWIDSPGYCRSASRYIYLPDVTFVDIGFRVVCAVPRSS